MKTQRTAKAGPKTSKADEARTSSRGAGTAKKAGRRPVRDAGRAPVDASPRARAGEREPRRRADRSRPAPSTTPIKRLTDTPARPKTASQAKARAKARKAKAPKVVRPPLKQRILVRLDSIDLNPRRLVARVPFVVLVIGCLGLGLGVTLWLSTDAAERSYQLGHARQVNQALLQQKEALERDVLQAQAAPALAEAARNLGMIPSRDTAHLVQDASGNWVVVGTPKPAEGVPPPPLNAPLPEPAPPAPPAPRVVTPSEVPVRLPSQIMPLTAPLPGQAPLLPGQVPPLPAAAPGAPQSSEVPHAVSGALPGPIPAPADPAVPAQPAAPVDLTAPVPGPPA
ncbi:MAG: hypothetical protein PGN37_08100 [Mycobacterium kyogaense]|uniref:hypothetical protein n=1 Tax=Mycobacterium kyogaense TaxID=2212479 RepID=UPI002FF64C74